MEGGEADPAVGGVLVDLLSGTAAGASQLIVGHPFDTIKVKLQTMPAVRPGQPLLYAGPFDAVRQTVAQQGVRGLYKGMGAPLATVAAFNAILFSTWGGLERVLAHPDGAQLTIGETALAGGVAGVPVSLLATPTELLKCRLQAQGGHKPPPGHVNTLADVRAGKALLRGPADVMRHVLRHEGGALGLYRGLLATLAREVPGNAAYFGVYEWLKRRIAASQGVEVSQLGAVPLMVAGGAGGAAFWVGCYPIDSVKSRLQVQSYFAPRYSGMLDCARQVVAEEGWHALFRGFGPCFTRSIPANAIAFVVFEWVRKTLSGGAPEHP